MESKRQKTQYRKVSDSSSKEEQSFVSLDATISLEVWKDFIFPFVGSGNFRFLGPVNKQFRSLYLEMDSSSTTTYDQIVTVKQAKLFYEDIQEGGLQIAQKKAHQLSSCEVMARLGRQEVLEYFHAQQFAWDEEVCLAAAQGGHFTLLQWLRERGCPWVDIDVCDAAAEMEQGFVLNTHTCIVAAKNGHLNVLQWLWIEKECPWHTMICDKAAENGHLHVIQWARSEGCPWDHDTLRNSIKNGHMDVLVFALDHDCPTDDKNLCYYAAKYGQLEILQYLHARGGFVLDESVMVGAAEGNYFEIVEWLYSVNCPWDASACSGAAEVGNLEMLQWLRARDCPWGHDVYISVHSRNHKDIMKWARENGCRWKPINYRCLRGV